MSEALRGAADRAAPHEDAPEFPAPLEHRGPDNVRVFRDGHGHCYAVDDDSPEDRWMTYVGPTVEVYR